MSTNSKAYIFWAVLALAVMMMGCADDPFRLQANPNNGAYELVAISGAALPTQGVVEGGLSLFDGTFTLREVYAVRIPSGGWNITARWYGTGEYKYANNGVVTFVAGEGDGTRLLRREDTGEWTGEYNNLWYGILTDDEVQLWDGGTTVREYRRQQNGN